MLVQGNQGAQNARGQTRRHDEVGGRLLGEDTCVGTTCSAVPSARTSSLGLAEGEIRDCAKKLARTARERPARHPWSGGLELANARSPREIRRVPCDQLVESVLAGQSWLTPEDFTGCVVDLASCLRERTAVGLHGRRWYAGGARKRTNDNFGHGRL